MNLRILSLDHNYFWRHLHSRALPTLAPSFGSHGLQGQSKAPTPYLCDWKVKGKLELGLSHSCLFISQGSSSHTHRNVPKPFPPLWSTHTSLFQPLIPALSRLLSHSPPQEAGSPTHWPLQHLPSCLSSPPALKPGSSPPRASASSSLTQPAAGRESPACLCPQPPIYMLVQTLTALVWSRSQPHRHQLEMHQK